eukprot:TRINITY_DN4446_c0_g2_i1.p1 TRINITY_DN4446_c0_g2~~TRINITY_DN4446_c0_g2_i1.p1  ORF type:complete len:483 (-),score=110.02 TRINITY_DN4446_c0_g2_i1:50-1498(-)
MKTLEKTCTKETKQERRNRKEDEQAIEEVNKIRFGPNVNFAVRSVATEVVHPFRWDLNNVTGLGRKAFIYRNKLSLNKHLANDLRRMKCYDFWKFFEEFQRCVANTLALSHGSDLLFLGRSPEMIYDFLCGCFKDDESLVSKLKLMHFSMRSVDEYEWKHDIIGPSSRMSHMMTYMTSLGLDPQSLLKRKTPIAIVDFVYGGETLDNLLWLIRAWTIQLKCDWNAVRQKIMVIAIRSVARLDVTLRGQEWMETYGGPKHWFTVWTSDIFWVAVADRLIHMEHSYPMYQWGKNVRKRVVRAGLHTELFFYETAQTKGGRQEFVSELVKVNAGMRQAWFRSLVIWLKGNCKKPLKIHDNVHQVNLKKKTVKMVVEELGKREALDYQHAYYKSIQQQALNEKLEKQSPNKVLEAQVQRVERTKEALERLAHRKVKKTVDQKRKPRSERKRHQAQTKQIDSCDLIGEDEDDEVEYSTDNDEQTQTE